VPDIIVGRYAVASSVQKLIAMQSNKLIDGNHWRDGSSNKFRAFS